MHLNVTQVDETSNGPCDDDLMIAYDGYSVQDNVIQPDCKDAFVTTVVSTGSGLLLQLSVNTYTKFIIRYRTTQIGKLSRHLK